MTGILVMDVMTLNTSELVRDHNSESMMQPTKLTEVGHSHNKSTASYQVKYCWLIQGA